MPYLFIESLDENYSLKLRERANRAIKGYLKYNLEDLKNIVGRNFETINGEFNLEILS